MQISGLEAGYLDLPERMRAPAMVQPVAAPAWLWFNAGLAEDLGLEGLGSETGLQLFAGNLLPEGAVALAYAGHQFGGFVPSLGDGRAVLLGIARGQDLQLKGSGQTVFSRRGDGRAALGPVLREVLISEAMAALGVPTTRALAAVSTGEIVARGRAQKGAVLARTAASHLRVGSFQYAAARGDLEALEALMAHAIRRHYPRAEGPLGLLAAVVAAQADLIARWMSIGFIHGVMNTDNMTISGETIDYGPCAFMDHFRQNKVFSSIDAQGRYAYAMQPQVAAWNLAQLASSLLPLIEREMPEAAAIAQATAVIEGFKPAYEAAWLREMGAKLGISAPEPADRGLIESLLRRMESERADFTRVFAGLASGRAAEEFAEPMAFTTWEADWRARIAREACPEALMARTNPQRTPRNHQVEAALQAADTGDLAPFERLLGALQQPFETRPDWAEFASSPKPEEEVRQTFCGT